MAKDRSSWALTLSVGRTDPGCIESIDSILLVKTLATVGDQPLMIP